MQLEDYSSQRGNMNDLNNLSANLYRSILQGGQLPGNLGGAYGIGQGQTQEMVNQSLNDLYPQLQASGGFDSGLATQIAANTSAGVRNQNAQFNVNAIQQLLGMGSSGVSNNMNSFNQRGGMIGNQLSGLRSMKTTTLGMNPFMKSFQQGLGDSLGRLPTQAADFASKSAMMCWVASEIFGGWYHPKTVMARFYIKYISPKLFRDFYIDNGEKIAKFISKRPILKLALRPLFELFALIGEKECLRHSRIKTL